MKYLARIREEDKSEQLLIDHLTQTAEMSERFAKEFDNSEYGHLCGLLHDLGKYSDAFQRRLNGGKKCDHSTAGAKVIFNSGPFWKIPAYCITGHHSGLLDIGSKLDADHEGTLYSRLSSENEIDETYIAYKKEISQEFKITNPPKIKLLNKFGFTFAFFIRMLYSCLVDADFLNTEEFMTNGKTNRTIKYDFKSMLDSLNKKYEKFKGSTGIINEKRTEIFNKCIKKANSERGLFSLTVPTGGGKTLSSMAFALNHAIRNGMRRIIYVIPYTSIIEQNAKEFSDIFGDNLVLEHHSNYDFSNNEHDCNNIKKLASENWDMPIIVTTNVQFFESLFANKSSRCRKLHNIANSVIIFDEAQMLPTEYLIPCIRAISELVYNYKCSAVLCTATQPFLTEMFPKEINITEICENTDELYQIFKRTKIVQRGVIDTSDLANEINCLHQALVIVNTRKHALKLFSMLNGENVFHLSTLMCPMHRKEKIAKIKELLRTGKPCKVVSTRLIEAGVDVDFPIVYRANAGLDSIIQSAGRCNRDGKLRDNDGNLIVGEVHVFEPEAEFKNNQPNAFKRPIEVTDIINNLHDDITSPQAIKDYFERLYFFEGENGLDIKGIVKSLEDGVSLKSGNPDAQFNFNFKTIAEKFKLIEDNTYPVIIPFDDKAEKLIEKLRYAEHFGGILRSLQGYTINLYKTEYESLVNSNKLDFVTSETPVLRSISNYSLDTGIKINIQMGIGICV